MAGSMIPLNILTQQSLFILLHQIDLDLAKQVKNKRCPIVGGLCILPITCVNLEAALLIYRNNFKFVSAFAAAVKVVVAESFLRRSDSGGDGFIGRL